MRFNTAIFFAIAATSSLVAAAPAPVPTLPAWNGKDAEAGYKAVALGCAAGATYCYKHGMDKAGLGLAITAGVAGGAATAVTGSQGDIIPAVAKGVGNGIAATYNAAKDVAVAGKDKVVSGAGAAAKCIGDACSAAIKKLTPERPAHTDVESGGHSHTNRKTRRENRSLISRSPGFEAEVDEDSVLLARYAEPQPETGDDDSDHYYGSD